MNEKSLEDKYLKENQLKKISIRVFSIFHISRNPVWIYFVQFFILNKYHYNKLSWGNEWHILCLGYLVTKHFEDTRLWYYTDTILAKPYLALATQRNCCLMPTLPSYWCRYWCKMPTLPLNCIGVTAKRPRIIED